MPLPGDRAGREEGSPLVLGFHSGRVRGRAMSAAPSGAPGRECSLGHSTASPGASCRFRLPRRAGKGQSDLSTAHRRGRGFNFRVKRPRGRGADLLQGTVDTAATTRLSAGSGGRARLTLQHALRPQIPCGALPRSCCHSHRQGTARRLCGMPQSPERDGTGSATSVPPTQGQGAGQRPSPRPSAHLRKRKSHS